MIQIHDTESLDRLTAALAPRLPFPPPRFDDGAEPKAIRRMTRWRVRHDIPPIYDAYLKLLHPIWENLEVPDFEETWDAWDCVQRGPKPADLSPMLDAVWGVGTLQHGSPDHAFPARRILWRDLADRFGVRMRPTISAQAFSEAFPGGSWPRRLVGPSEGHLEPEDAAVLTSHLRRHTPAGWCWLYFWYLTISDGTDRLFRADLSELPAAWLDHEKLHLSPTRWFPDDQSWSVYTDYDGSETLLGCSRGLADDLLADPRIEVVEVASDTPLGRWAEREPRPDEGIVLVEDLGDGGAENAGA